MKKMNKITLQLKPVGNNCNLGCVYCYAMPFRSEKTKILDFDLLEKIVKEAFEMSDNVIVSWHGGEPMMTGVEYYKRYMELVNKYKGDNQKITNMIQTSATLVTDEFAKFFKENDFIVSVSIDGNENTHNRNRYYMNKKGSYASVMKGVNKLREHGIYPPVIATVTRNNYNDCEKTFNSLIENGFKVIKFSPVYDSVDDEFSISSNEWFEYLNRVLNMWTKLGDTSIRVRELDEVLEWFLGSTINTCSSTNSCISWMSINSNGEIYPCEYLRATESYGNIKDIHLWDVIETEPYKIFLKKVLYVPDECKKCEFYSKCGNGCPATRLKQNIISYDGVYVYCDERKKLYNAIKNIIE